MPLGIQAKGLIIGLLIGYLVIPFIMGKVLSKKG